MNKTPPNPQPGLSTIIDSYLRAVDAGKRPDPEALIRTFPHLAKELRDFFATLQAPTRAGDPVQGEKPKPVRKFGDYEIEGEIARGGMGIVYRARQVSLDRPVALKMILVGNLASGDDVRRFRAEAEAAARLDHPNIVPIYEVGEHNGKHYFSMKLIEGSGLNQNLGRFRDDPEAAARLLATVARAVHHAHQRGILHRDLKPGNILLDAQGQPHVTDFGLAKSVEKASGLTQSGAIVGTPEYMAPEQARASKVITTAADVYGLGAVLYALLTTRSPFQGENVLETLQLVVGSEPIPPRSLNPALDRDLETICLKCLRKEPGERYGSAEALAEDLDRYLRGEAITARPVSTRERVVKWVKRNPVVAGLLSAVLVVTIVGFAATLWQYGVALRAADLAEKRREEAERKTREAEQAGEAAKKAEGEAKLQAEVAEQRKTEAEEEREKTTHSLYANQLLRVAAIARQDPLTGLELLEDVETCPPRLRDFAWRHLYHLCNREVRTVSDIGSTYFLALSADGKVLATAGSEQTFGPVNPAEVVLWDVAAGKRRGAVRPPPPPSQKGLLGTPLPATEKGSFQGLRAMALSPDGKVLATAEGADSGGFGGFGIGGRPPGRLSLWDTETGKAVGEAWEPKDLLVSAVAFSPDGKRLAVGLSAHRFGGFTGFGEAPPAPPPPSAVSVREVAGLKLIKELKPALPGVDQVAFSPDGHRLAAVATEWRGSKTMSAFSVVQAWDLDSGKELLRLNEDVVAAQRPAFFTADSQSLVAARTNRLSAWDLATGKEQLWLTASIGQDGTTSYSADRGTLAGALGYRPSTVLRVWNVPRNEPQTTLRGQFMNAVVTPDGKTLLTVGPGGPFSSSSGSAPWAWAETREPSAFQLNLPGFGGRVPDQQAGGAFRPPSSPLRYFDLGDRDLFAFTAGSVRAMSRTGEVLVVDPRADGGSPQTEVWELKGDRAKVKLPGKVGPAAVTSDGKQVVFTTEEFTAQVVDAATGKERFRVPTQLGPLSGFQLEANGKLLTMAGGGGWLAFDATTGKMAGGVPARGLEVLGERAVGPDGRTMAQAVAVPQASRSLLSSGSAVRSVEVKAYDVATGQERFAVKDAAGPLVYSPDGALLVVVRIEKYKSPSDHDVRGLELWSVSEKKKVADLPLPPAPEKPGEKENPFGQKTPSRSFARFSPDGRTLALGRDPDDAITLWDVGESKERMQLSGPRGRTGGVVFSPDGAALAAWGDDGAVSLFDTKTGKERHALRTGQTAVRTVAFNPQGTRLATLSGGGSVKLWDAADGKELRTLAGFSGAESVRFLGDGRGLILHTGNRGYQTPAAGRSQFWDAETGEQKGVFLEGPARVPSGAALSADGKTVLLFEWNEQGRAIAVVCDAETGKELQTLDADRAGTGFSREDLGAVFFGDEGRAVVQLLPGGLRVLDRAGKERFTLDKIIGKQPRNEGVAVWLSPDTRFALAITREGEQEYTLRCIDLAAGKEAWSVPKAYARGDASALFSNDGKSRFAGVTKDHVVFTPNGKGVLVGRHGLYDLATGQPHLTLPEGAYRGPVSPDGKMVVAQVTVNNRSVVKLFSTQTGKELRALEGKESELSLSGLMFSPDGKLLLGPLSAASYEERISANNQETFVWDTATGKKRRMLPVSGEVVFSSDWKLLAARERAGPGALPTVKVWDLAAAKERCTVGDAALAQSLQTFRLSPDGKSLLTLNRESADPRAKASEEYTLRLWDAETGQERWATRVTHGHPASGTIEPLAFTPDSKTILGIFRDNSSNSSLVLFNAADGKERAAFEKVHAEGYSSDRAGLPQLLTGGKVLQFRDREGMKRVDVASGEVRVAIPVSNWFRASADGRTVVFVGAEGVQVADGETGKVRRTIDRPKTPLAFASVTPDGRLLALYDKEDIRARDLEGRERYSLPAGPGTTITEDGALIVIPVRRQTLRSTDPGTGETQTLADVEGTPRSLALSPDGRRAVVAVEVRYQQPPRPGVYAEQVVYLFDLPSRKLLSTLSGFSLSPLEARFSPDGEALATLNREVKLWSAADGQHRATLSLQQPAVGLAFSPDGKTLATAHRSDATPFQPGARNPTTVALWDAPTGKQKGTLEKRLWDAIAFGPDGKQLLSWPEEGTLTGVVLLDLATGKDRTFPTVRGPAALSPDGKTLAALGAGDAAGPAPDQAQSVLLIDPGTGRELLELKAQPGPFTSRAEERFSGRSRVLIGQLEFAPDGGRLLAVSATGALSVWETAEPGADRLFTNGTGAYLNGSLDVAVRLFREAVRIEPKHLEARYNLALAVARSGNLDEAEKVVGEAANLGPQPQRLRVRFARFLLGFGATERARTYLREVVDRNKGQPPQELVDLLRRQEMRDEIVKLCKSWGEADAKNPAAPLALGNELINSDREGEAKAAFEESLRRATAANNQGAQGAARAALRDLQLRQGVWNDELRKGMEAKIRDLDETVKKQPFHFQAKQQLDQLRAQLRLENKLAGYRAGKEKPANVKEKLELAAFARDQKRLYATAAKLLREAITEQPALANDPQAGHHLNAAFAAARAGSGQGRDAVALSEAERADWRKQALAWARADLEASRKQLQEKPKENVGRVQSLLDRMRSDPALAAVRDAEPLGKLPEEERASWANLWSDAASLAREADGLAGRWKIDGVEVAQEEVRPSAATTLYFGDPEWTDYDLTFEAQVRSGSGEFGVCFRALDADNQLLAVFARPQGSADKQPQDGVVSRTGGAARAVGDWVEGRNQPGEWVGVRVEARGKEFKVYATRSQGFNFQQPTGMRELFAFEIDGFPRGAVGLRTVGTSVRFRNIRVTDPNGKVLFEGVPKVE